MKFRFSYLVVFCCILVSLGSCVEQAKLPKYQTLHLYTDFPKSFSTTFFRNFGRVNHLHVQVHHMESSEIIKRIKEKKYESDIDAVILRNAMDLIQLNELGAVQSPKADEDFYQALLHDPYVFQFPFDSVPLFSSYGQIFRSQNVKVNPDSIRSPHDWTNLMGGLIEKYPDVKPKKMFATLLHTDSVEGKKLKQIKIVRHSMLSNTKGVVYPDQYYKGSIGMISGMVLIRQSKNRTNALMLYDYCKNEWWRKKLAGKLNLFPIVSEEQNKTEEILLYQGLIKNSKFIKKL